MARSLQQWLDWQETLHPANIELGLARVAAVHRAMQADTASRPGDGTSTSTSAAGVRILVAGTNGKGSSVAMLEAIYRAAGYSTAAYTSPHLWHYNERLRLDGQAIDDAALCAAFERVEQARGEVELTYFEFGTLAILDLIDRHQPDVALLEVGLGGRLDAVNIIDADISLITNIGLDHQDWLGDNRESIGREKAGIMRAGRPAVFAAVDMPASVADHAADIGATLLAAGQDFTSSTDAGGWTFHRLDAQPQQLPLPAMAGAHQVDNAAAVVMVTELLAARLPIAASALAAGLTQLQLPGRSQWLPGQPELLLDVAHNAEGAVALAAQLQTRAATGTTTAVIGVLADKDLDAMLTPLLGVVDYWIACELPMTPRATAAAAIEASLRRLGVASAAIAPAEPDPAAALAAARRLSPAGDRVVVFGSFYTVAAVLPEPATAV